MQGLEPDPSYSQKLKYWNNSTRASVVYVAFGIMALALIAGIASSYSELQLLEEFQLTGELSDADAESNDLRQLIMLFLIGAVRIGTIVVFLNWFKRSFENLYRLNLPNLTETKSMLIWNWFIPVLNWFKPFNMMKELWSKMHEFLEGSDQKQKPKFILIELWWAFYLVTHFAGPLVLNFTVKIETVEGMIADSWVSLILDALAVLESLIVILLVRKYSTAEKEVKAKVLVENGIVLELD